MDPCQIVRIGRGLDPDDRRDVVGVEGAHGVLDLLGKVGPRFQKQRMLLLALDGTVPDIGALDRGVAVGAGDELLIEQRVRNRVCRIDGGAVHPDVDNVHVQTLQCQFGLHQRLSCLPRKCPAFSPSPPQAIEKQSLGWQRIVKRCTTSGSMGGGDELLGKVSYAAKLFMIAFACALPALLVWSYLP